MSFLSAIRPELGSLVKLGSRMHSLVIACDPLIESLSNKFALSPNSNLELLVFSYS